MNPIETITHLEDLLMTKRYSDKEIATHLKRESIGILGTWDEETDSIRQRVMYYGCDPKLNFYLMSTKGGPKSNKF
jgi:hypothetical protein